MEWTNSSTSGETYAPAVGEDIRTDKPQLLAHQTEDGTVDQSVFHLHRQRNPLAVSQILHIALLSHRQCMQEQLALNGTSAVDLLFHTHIHLLPETRNTRHAGRMGFAQRLLNFLRVSVDNELCSHCQRQVRPSALKDMCQRQRVNHLVVLRHRHALAVSLHSSMILSAGQHHPLRVASRPAGIENIT